MKQDIAVLTATEQEFRRWCADEGVEPYRGRVRRIRRPFDMAGMPPTTWVVVVNRPTWWATADHEEFDERKAMHDAHAAEEAPAPGDPAAGLDRTGQPAG